MKLKVKPEEARAYLSWVKHDTFSEAIEEHWIVDEDGNVRAQSALWLYCWGKTGMNSDDVANHVRRLFDGIMSVSFDEFDRRIPHEWAQDMRYRDGDIEAELAQYLLK